MVKSDFANHMKELSVLANQMAPEVNDLILFGKIRQAAKRLSRIVDEKDSYGDGHSERKAFYAASIGRELGLEPLQIEVVQIASFLHDIGKLGIGNEILQKPGKLDSIELKAIQKHPLIGERILTPIGLNGRMLQAIRYHHEAPDGTGYPDGLKGDEIPLEARIVKVADAFTAMIEHRPYRGPLSMQEAMEQLIELAGRGFDTKVVKALIKVMENEKRRGFSKSQPLTQKILVVKEERAKDFLENQGFETLWANNGQEALQLVFATFPNLVLLNKTITDISPHYFCRRIKGDPRTVELPIIVLAKRRKAEEEVAFLNDGANDYLTMPPASESARLIARIKSHIHRNINGVSINPLTGLPQSFFIEERIKMYLSNKKEGFSILFIDLDNFKVFNSRFGFLKGDELLKIVAQILTSAVEELGNETDLIGHRGGDDFIIITTPDKIDVLCKQIILEFDDRVKAFYSIEERTRGFITFGNEPKKATVHPITTVSIGVVSNKDEEINSYYEIEEMAAQVLESAKEIHRSSYY